jgi:hypothetical protein
MRSTQEILRFIDKELTAEQRSQARWKFARELLVMAERCESGAISYVRTGNFARRCATTYFCARSSANI